MFTTPSIKSTLEYTKMHVLYSFAASFLHLCLLVHLRTHFPSPLEILEVVGAAALNQPSASSPSSDPSIPLSSSAVCRNDQWRLLRPASPPTPRPNNDTAEVQPLKHSFRSSLFFHPLLIVSRTFWFIVFCVTHPHSAFNYLRSIDLRPPAPLVSDTADAPPFPGPRADPGAGLGPIRPRFGR